MSTHYRGWIPTVSGRLSFSHFGTSVLNGSRSYTRSDGDTRYLLVVQNRTTWDVKLPAWAPIERALKMQGRFHFVCLAKTEDAAVSNGAFFDKQGALVGRVFIISDRSRWKEKVKELFFSAARKIDEYARFPTKQPIRDYFETSFEETISKIGPHCAFQCQFALKRNGVIDFYVDDTHDRAADAPEFPTGDHQQAVTSQVFSFLRDVGHVHQHHAKSSDTIVDIYPINDEDDITWRRNVLYSIYRRVISFKRQCDIAVQIQSVGLLSYADAFKKAWIEERPSGSNEIPVFHDEPMKESIRASELRMRYRRQQSSERSAVCRTVTLSILGLVISLASLIKVSSISLNVAPSPALQWITRQLITQPFRTAFDIGAVALFVALVSSSQFRPDGWKFFRFFQALAQPYRSKVVFGAYVIVSLVGILIALRLFG